MALHASGPAPAVTADLADRYVALPPRALRGVLASLALVMLAASLDATAVGTALPRIVTDLHGNDLYAWVFTIYLLTMTVTMPVWGSLSDRFGRRSVLFIGLGIFVVGSALCGLSQQMWQLVVFRGIQGLGAGAIVPISLATIGDLYPPADRARLQAAFSSLFVLAFLIGPTLGGVLTDTVGWRWVFYINLPVGLVALAVMARFMPPLIASVERHAFDVLGVVLFTAAVVPFLIGVRNLPDGTITDPAVGGLMLLGALLGAIFVFAETRAQEPIVPVGLFRDPTFAVASAVVLLAVAGLFVSIVFMPRYFQFVHGASATSSGWQIMTLLLGLIVGAIGCGQIVAKTGHWKLLLLGAMVVGASGMLLLSGLRADSPLPFVWAAMFLTGLGLGPITSVLTAVVQTTVPPDVMGVATSTVTFFRQLGASIWLAISGSVFSTVFRDQLPTRMTANGVPEPLAASLTSGTGAVASEASTNVGDLGVLILNALPPETRPAVEPFIGGIAEAMHQAFSLATGSAFWIGIVAVAVAFLILLPLRETRLPLERLAEIRGRSRAATSAPSPAGATSQSIGSACVPLEADAGRMNASVITFARLTTEDHASAGGKGATLARLYQAGYPVPDGFIILPVAFEGDDLTALARVHVQACLTRLSGGRPDVAFAVRSSATSEDSALASFAGEFETVLDARTEEDVYAAVAAVRRSRHGERVQAYREARGVSREPDLAVVVQRLVRADLAGVLFTADPASGSRLRMVGNYVHGLGDRLVSGEADPDTFTLELPSGRYDGPPELARSARSLHRLGRRLEEDLGGPQDVEWAIAADKLFLLQSRPITSLQGHDPATGEWNDSLTGDYLWSSVNVSEAVPDVMTPSTWSLWQIYHFEATPIRIPGKHPFCGNIGGRPYLNLSLLVSLYRAIGRDVRRELPGDMVGTVPRDLDIPIIPFTTLSVLRTALPGLLRARWHVSRDLQRLERFVASTPAWCHTMRDRIREAHTQAELAGIWRDELKPYFMGSCWLVRGATMRFSDPATKLRLALADLVGEADANALMSDLAGESAEMASLGPLVGLARVQRGEMSGEAYIDRYGHRGPHEMELFAAGPDEDPAWLDHRLAEAARQPLSVDELLVRQRGEAAAAWQRLRERYPRKAASIRRELDRTAAAARAREAVRSEMTRITRVVRQFVLRAGELSGLGEGAFFLSLDELTGVLSGDDTSVAFIPARRATYGRYSALPPYPAVINGRFDPFQWAAEPPSVRRSDFFDSHRPVAASGPGTITGHAGAAGRVDGLVRRLDNIEDADQFQPGEILVTTTTNVGWTPLFPRAAAIVTDVGAPLSHAAIVARELGIPAVVGCGDATMRLQTGDLVHVDGERGFVEIREPISRPALRPPGEEPDRDRVEGALRSMVGG